MLKSRLKLVLAQYNVERAQKDEELFDLPKLAATTGLAYTTVQRLYNHSSDRVDLKTLDTLTDFFGIGLDALFEKIPNKVEAEAEADDQLVDEVTAIATELVAA